MGEKRIIYVFHEYGARKHYLALETLAKRHEYVVKYREFSFRMMIIKLFKGQSSIKHLLQNFGFIVALPFKHSTKIIIGIAPFNKKLPYLMKLLKRHEVYYHTSCCTWEGKYMPHNSSSSKLINKWKDFTNKYVRHIFAVSEKTKKEMIINGFAGERQISVVNHSYPRRISIEDYKEKEMSFIQVGSLSPDKGVEELLGYFSVHPELKLTLVGGGRLQSKVEEYAYKYPNITYKGYIADFNKLVDLYKNHSFMILNSHRRKDWEEVFGMVLIEGMACGCVPITTNHPGPKEVIKDGYDGFCMDEGRITDGLEIVQRMPKDEYIKMKKRAIRKGQSFYCENMAEKWSEIFNFE